MRREKSRGATQGSARLRLGILFSTVLVDLIGFGIVLPLLPLYARDFGAGGFAVGLLVTSYSLVQLVMAPLWGRVSDRIGRRPVLALGLLGSGLAYVAFARADSLAALFLSRVIGGIGGSTIPVAQAYIADVTPPERRAGNMGLIGAAFGLGFVIGPALGWYVSGRYPSSPAGPGYLAAALCFANVFFALALLPESKEAGRRPRVRASLLAAFAEAARTRQLRLALATYLCITVAFSALQPTLSLLAADRFGMVERQAALLFLLLGVVSAVVQGGIVRAAVPRMGERGLLRASTAPFAAGLLMTGLANTTSVLVGGLVLVGIGYGCAVPSVLGLVSRACGPRAQGAGLGIGQSVGSFARVVGPVAAGALFDIRLALPYVAAALAIGTASIVSRGIVQPCGRRKDGEAAPRGPARPANRGPARGRIRGLRARPPRGPAP